LAALLFFRAALLVDLALFRAALLADLAPFRAALLVDLPPFRAALLVDLLPFRAALLPALALFRAADLPLRAVLRAERRPDLAAFRADFLAALLVVLVPDFLADFRRGSAAVPDWLDEDSSKSNERDEGLLGALSEGRGSIHPEPDQPISI
jgi:hypothetical protein